MTRIIMLFFLLIIVFDSRSQTIINITSPDTIDFVTNKPVKEINETFNGNGEESVLSYNLAGRLISKVNISDDEKPKFSLYWEYKDALPIKRIDIKEFNFGKDVSYYLYKYDTANYLIGIANYRSNSELIVSICIKNDSLGKPISLKTYDHGNNLIGYEVAKYYYSDNLMEIKVYNNLNQITGIIIYPINCFMPITAFDEFIVNHSYYNCEKEAKDWNNLRVSFEYFTYKFNKEGVWIKKNQKIIGYYPSSKKIEYFNDGIIKRRISKYY
jgi:hypothetical protein